jgi:hypothetical protein
MNQLIKDTVTGFGMGIGAAGYLVMSIVAIDKLDEWDVEHEDYLKARKNYTGYNETPLAEKVPHMNIAKKALHRTQKFVADHKVAVAVTLTAVTTVVVMDKLRGGALTDHVEFLKEKDLHDEYINWITTPVE